jgi:hypothetical protein
MAHETTNTTERGNYFLNHFHALNSILVMEKIGETRNKINTDALIEIFGTYDKTADKDWLIGSIESALEEKDEAKQIFNLAEALRIDYLSSSISDVESIQKAIDKVIEEDKQHRLYLIIDYLMSSLYEIDLFDVAQELIARYKNDSLFITEN